jgi:DNA polymerase elongation subunit (family B)
MDYKRKPKLLFLDLETDSLDVQKAKIKFVGMMDESGKETLMEWNQDNRKAFLDKINGYDKIITFNGTAYDCLILKNHGVEIPHWRHIDVYEVYKKRAPLIRSGGFRSYSLKNLVIEVGIKTDGKGSIDYHIFQKDEWSPEELKEIYTYLKQDLVVCKELWDYLVKKFDNMKEFLNEKDQFNLKYITSSTGAYAYMMIANALGVNAEYTNDEGQIPYQGAYVMQPIHDVVKGNLLYLDFASLYPMIYIHNNLFSSNCTCCVEEEKWHGNSMFKVEGKYCSKKQGRIEELIKKFYLQRKEYKKQHDPREFAIKITLNSLYGISAKPSFKYLYSQYTASDCTSLSRQCIDYAIKSMNSAGYEVIYADTDSAIVDLKGKPRQECLDLALKVSKELSNAFPFPWEEFNFKLEDDLTYICFFKDKTGELKKKNYIYINKNGKMTIKGLDILKKNCSDLGLKIFEDYLRNQILERKDCLFEKKYIDELIESALFKNKNIIAKKFNIKEHEEYASKTSIYNLIKEKYGTGEIKLIKNHKIGAGKGVKYCSIEEAEQLSIADLDLDDVYKELSPFIIDFHKIMAEQKLAQKLLKKAPKIDPKQKTLFN